MIEEIKSTKTTYIKEGKEYDRITSVLDYFANPKLVEWKLKVGKKEANKISKVAKTIGTRVDGLVKSHILSGKVGINKNDSGSVVNCFRGYLQWTKDHNPKIIGTDQTLFWDELGVAGTLDLLDNKVIDIKCSTDIRKNYWIQVMMYAKMLKLRGVDIKEVAILRLDKLTGEYEYKVIPYDERFVNLFIGLLANYRYQIEKENDDGDTGSVEAGIELAFCEIQKEYGF